MPGIWEVSAKVFMIDTLTVFMYLYLSSRASHDSTATVGGFGFFCLKSLNHSAQLKYNQSKGSYIYLIYRSHKPQCRVSGKFLRRCSWVTHWLYLCTCIYVLVFMYLFLKLNEIIIIIIRVLNAWITLTHMLKGTNSTIGCVRAMMGVSAKRYSQDDRLIPR